MLDQHAVIVVDTEGMIRLWSIGAETLFGYQAVDAIGQSLDLIIPESYRGSHWPAFKAAMASGVNHYDNVVFADPITHADGRVVHHRGRFALMKDADGRVLGAFATWDAGRPEDVGRAGPSVVASAG